MLKFVELKFRKYHIQHGYKGCQPKENHKPFLPEKIIAENITGPQTPEKIPLPHVGRYRSQVGPQRLGRNIEQKKKPDPPENVHTKSGLFRSLQKYPHPGN